MKIVLTGILEERREYLESVIESKKTFIDNGPEGRLRTAAYKGHTSYYQVTEAKDSTGKYLPKEKTPVIKDLAQKGYDSKVILAAEKEIALLNKLVRFQEQTVESVYETLSPTRQKLVTPVRLPDDEYIRQWLDSKKCDSMGFDEGAPVIMTAAGCRVRSKSEQLWADTFTRLDVPYVFEPMLYLKGRGWVRPDFVGLNVRLRKEIWVEHMGIMDSMSYSEDNVKKLHDYERNGFILGDSLLITMETRRSPLELRSVEDLIKKHFL